MYQVTWIDAQRVHSVTTPSAWAARTLKTALRMTGFAVRLWNPNKTLAG